MSKLDENKVSTGGSELLADVIKEEKRKKEDNDTDKKNDKKADGDKKQKTESGGVKKLKHGAMATTLTVIFFVFLVLVNVVATKLFESLGRHVVSPAMGPEQPCCLPCFFLDNRILEAGISPRLG